MQSSHLEGVKLPHNLTADDALLRSGADTRQWARCLLPRVMLSSAVTAEALDQLQRPFARQCSEGARQAGAAVDDLSDPEDVALRLGACWRDMWEVREQRELTRAYLDALEHTVGFAGRGLLVPTLLGIGGWATRHPRLPAQAKVVLGAPKLAR